MKKIVALLLALLLCLGSFPAFAELDFSRFTSDELIYLRNEINKELLKRGIEKEVEVPIGKYEVGVEIPAGTYTIRSEGHGVIEVYENSSAKYYTFHEGLTSWNNTYIGKLTLVPGNIVEITYGTLIFSPYQGLGF